MKLLMGGYLHDVFAAQLETLKREVASQNDNYLLNVNETEFIAHLVDKFRIEPLVIHEDQVTVSQREEMIPAERFDNFRFNVTPGKSYQKQVVRYHVPFSGEIDLLKYKASTSIMWTTDIGISGGEMQYDIINFSNDVGQIKRDWEHVFTNLKQLVGYAAADAERYNRQLESEANAAVANRKAEVVSKSSLLSSLGVPVKKADNVPSTFAVPALKKRIAIGKPTAPTTAAKPEPTLNETVYHDILKVIHDMGVEIERHPSIYEGKDEETMRDHFLMTLAPNFDSVSGETFNKAGKTDILIRHDKSNVFVAECLIWRGQAQFLEKIDQLLSYLTWRDSKTALVCFVPNQEFQAVVDTAVQTIKTHPSFVRHIAKHGDGWEQYEFTLPNDSTRTVKVALMTFHFPKKAEAPKRSKSLKK